MSEMKNEENNFEDVLYSMWWEEEEKEVYPPRQRQRRQHDETNHMTTTIELQPLGIDRRYFAKDRESNIFPQDGGNKDTAQDTPPQYSDEKMEDNYYETPEMGEGSIIEEDFHNITCMKDEWLCNDTMQCIPLEELCNGTTTCWNKPEEAHEICGRSYEIHLGFYIA